MSNQSEELNKQNAELQNSSAQFKRETAKELTEMRTKLYSYQKSQQEMLVEVERLKTQNTQLQSEKEKLMRETEEQLRSMRIKLNHFLNETLNEIEKLRKENSELQNERDKIVTDQDELLQAEIKLRREIEERLTSKMTELHNYQKSQEEMRDNIERLKKQNTERLLQINYVEHSFTEFTHAELREVTNNFSNSLKIGEGGYGPVYKAFLELKPVAIKILRQESRFGNNEFTQEVEILRSIKHPNLVMLLGTCSEARALAYELMPNGSLFDILRNKQQQSSVLSWKTRICIASNICSALIVLHSTKPHGIVHGDLKSANILLDSNYTAKLSDFGICRHLRQTDTRITPHHYTNYPKGTLPYMDPEYLETGDLTAQYDVYSFGIVLLELVTGRSPMAGFRKSVEAALRKGQNIVDSSSGEWPIEEAKRMVLLGLKCSDPSRENRPDLEKEVCVEIESMRRVSLQF